VTSSRRFKDHFSDVAAAYAAHRPSYPAGLVDFLARLAPAKRLAWDSGCGSGQLSVLLAGPFARVVATDASPEQIARAAVHPKVEYRCTRAEASGLPERVADLATAAQAVHWFDLPAYYAEVRRVARPDGIVAVISYGVVTADADVDAVIQPFYRNVLFPFEELAAPAFEIRLDWRLDDLIGYVGTWSAVWALEQAEGQGPFGGFRRDLAAAWGPTTAVRTVRWPLALRVGRV